MFSIDTKAYILSIFLSLFYFYGIFFSLYQTVSLRKRIVIVFILLPITFIGSIFTVFADILPMVGCYYILKKQKKTDYILLNLIITSMLTSYFVSVVGSSVIIPFFSFSGVKSFSFVFINSGIQLLVLVITILLFRYFSIGDRIKKYSSPSLSFLLCYLYLVSFLLLYAARYYEAFDKFVAGITFFFIIQTIFIVYIFIREKETQLEKYKHKLSQQQLVDLKRYTDQLEENQQKLRKFKHDYENLLLSLKDVVVAGQNEEAIQSIGELEKYSKENLSFISGYYKDIENIENTYLKSLIINKLFTIQNNDIICDFECKEVVQIVPMSIFDFVRVVGITLDNAIEGAETADTPKISILIYQDKRQLELVVENTSQLTNIPLSRLMIQGTSSKENHKGLGLSNIQEIKKSHPNLYIQYEKKINKFSANIIVLFESEEFHELPNYHL